MSTHTLDLADGMESAQGHCPQTHRELRDTVAALHLCRGRFGEGFPEEEHQCSSWQDGGVWGEECEETVGRGRTWRRALKFRQPPQGSESDQ